MICNKFNKFFSDAFLFKTSCLTFGIILCYIAEWLTNGVHFWECVYVCANFLYIPCVLFFGRKALVPYFISYSIILTFILGFLETTLFNNHSAVFIMSIVFYLDQRTIKYTPVLYIAVAIIVFIFIEENICHLLIHIFRTLWYLVIVRYVTKVHFKRTSLVLTEEEKEILQALEKCGNIKGIDFLSRNTVAKKLKEAKLRNNLPDTKEGLNQLRSIYRQMLNSSPEDKE